VLASSSMLTPEKAAVSAGIWVTHLLLGELPWENNPQIQCTALTLPHTEVAQTCSLCLHGRQDHQQPTLQMEKLRHRRCWARFPCPVRRSLGPSVLVGWSGPLLTHLQVPEAGLAEEEVARPGAARGTRIWVLQAPCGVR
jgi:hypothetical protein